MKVQSFNNFVTIEVCGDIKKNILSCLRLKFILFYEDTWFYMLYLWIWDENILVEETMIFWCFKDEFHELNVNIHDLSWISRFWYELYMLLHKVWILKYFAQVLIYGFWTLFENYDFCESNLLCTPWDLNDLTFWSWKSYFWTRMRKEIHILIDYVKVVAWWLPLWIVELCCCGFSCDMIELSPRVFFSTEWEVWLWLVLP